MKKLSVLLVIGLFCIPMLVYGFTQTSLSSVFSRSILSIVKIGMKSPDKASSALQQHLDPIETNAQEDSVLPNPFFIEPWGAKGKISAINPETKTITLENAVYFDAALNQFVTFDIQVFVNEETHYNFDLFELSSFEELQEGELVICSGPSIQFADKTMKFAADIYRGKFIADDATCQKNFLGPIDNLDKDSKTFTIDYFSEDGRVFTLNAAITQDTQVLTVRKVFPNDPIGPELGVIPDFVKNHDSVSGSFIIKQDFTAEVQLITFFEN